jgi:hypothetical protein
VKLIKISYMSAAVFGVLSFAMYLFLGVLQWSMRDVLMTAGQSITALDSFVIAPISGGVVGYLLALTGIAIYNLVARKYPISWELSKK